jgi:hypothetical protein
MPFWGLYWNDSLCACNAYNVNKPEGFCVCEEANKMLIAASINFLKKKTFDILGIVSYTAHQDWNQQH